MLYRVAHTTTYDYTQPVTLCHNVAHLSPRAAPRQTCRHSELLVTPPPAVCHARTDYFGNPVTFFTVQEPHQKLTVISKHLTAVRPFVAPEPTQTPPWEEARAVVPGDRRPEALDAFQFVFDSPYVRTAAELAEYAAPSFPAGRPILTAALDLTRRIHADFRFDPEATTVATTVAEVLAGRRGVCQDFAHLQIGCLRSLGLAARYVSGYLLTTPPPGRQRLLGVDASHAWVSLYCPGTGWVDLDPTNDLIPSDEHIVLAWGRDYDDVSPLKGVILGGGRHTVAVAVAVERVEERADLPEG
jgi:transglutaminase-like putative cysteine protease